MPLTNVLTVQIRPEAIGRYQELVLELAAAAKRKEDPFRWTAHMTVFGQGSTIHFVSITENYAELQERGQTPEMIVRVLGEDRAPEWLEAIGEATAAQEIVVSTDRPDLSYMRSEGSPQDNPLAVLTDIQIRPGAREAFEELIRKLAEAIPKVDDPTTLLTSQVVLGDLARYYTVRPLNDLAELDAQRTPEVLLNEAFGSAEGGLIFRNGGDAIREIQREIVMYRADLSNPE